MHLDSQLHLESIRKDSWIGIIDSIIKSNLELETECIDWYYQLRQY